MKCMKKIFGALDFGLHVPKGLMSQLLDLVEAMLAPEDRQAFSKALLNLHNGGATVRSCYHRRVEASAMRKILTDLGLYEKLGEVAEALDAFARLITWGMRVPYSTWKSNRSKTILMAGGLVAMFVITLKRVVPATVWTKDGYKPRQIYGSCFWHNLSVHLIEQLELLCTSHSMTEWLEMLWAPVRRLALRATDRKVSIVGHGS